VVRALATAVALARLAKLAKAARVVRQAGLVPVALQAGPVPQMGTAQLVRLGPSRNGPP